MAELIEIDIIDKRTGKRMETVRRRILRERLLGNFSWGLISYRGEKYWVSLVKPITLELMNPLLIRWKKGQGLYG